MNGINVVVLSDKLDIMRFLSVVKLWMHSIFAGYARGDDVVTAWVSADDDVAHLLIPWSIEDVSIRWSVLVGLAGGRLYFNVPARLPNITS